MAKQKQSLTDEEYFGSETSSVNGPGDGLTNDDVVAFLLTDNSPELGHDHEMEQFLEKFRELEIQNANLFQTVREQQAQADKWQADKLFFQRAILLQNLPENEPDDKADKIEIQQLKTRINTLKTYYPETWV